MCRQELDFERGTIAVNGKLFCSYRCLCQHVRDVSARDRIESQGQWFQEDQGY